MSKPRDEANRIAALDTQQSICVTAPAGSGKTELLSQRVLALLASVEQPEEILAITFTRKAAAEMHQRIMLSLREAQNYQADSDELPEHRQRTMELARKALQRDRELDWNLLDNSTRLKVQTIDSLSASITKQMPILSNFGAQPKICEDADRVYEEAVEEFLKLLESESTIADDLAVMLQHLDNDFAKVQRLLVSLLRQRDQWLIHLKIGNDSEKYRATLESTLEKVVTDLLEELRIDLSPFADELLPFLDYAASNLKASNRESTVTELEGIITLPSVAPNNVRQWLAIADLLLTGQGGWRKRVDVKTGFPTETQDGDKAAAKQRKEQFMACLLNISSSETLLEKLTELRCLPSASYSDGQWQFLDTIMRLLPSLLAYLKVVFQQRGEVDYSEISLAAIDALGDALEPSELALKLDYRLAHILIDEFQDTSSIQYNLIEKLTEGWNEYNQTHPENPHTIFIVGDGMQSIYGFREANVGLFLDARRNGINGIKLIEKPLSVNFRSDPIVVQWTNSLFSQAFPKTENLSRGAVAHEAADYFKPAQTGCEVRAFGFLDDDDNKSRQAEAEKTIELIMQAQKNDPDGSIAVLVRGRGHLLDIIPALSRSGIKANATDIDPLVSYSSINDLLTLTKALFNLADDISWTALLRSPWVGLNNEDVYSLIAKRGSHSVWKSIQQYGQAENLSRFAIARLKAVTDVLNHAFQQRQRSTARSWVFRTWLNLGGPAVLEHEHEFGLAADYFSLLERFQQGGGLGSIELFELAVRDLYVSSPPSSSKVHIMTIHKAKGLEFDTVILPGLNRSTRSDDKSLLMWKEYLPVKGGHTELIISPLNPVGGGKDPIFEHLRNEQSWKSRLENTRLFYVAATRAVKRLYLLFTGTADKKSGLAKPPAANSLLSSGWQTISESVEWASPLNTDEGITQFGLDLEGKSAQSLSRRLAKNWQAPQWSFPNPIAHFRLGDDSNLLDAGGHIANDEAVNPLNIPVLELDSLPRTVGNVVHQIMEQLASNSPKLWTAMDEDTKSRWLDGLLYQQSLVSTLWADAKAQIVHSIATVIEDPRGLWILSADQNSSRSEFEMLSTTGNGVVRRIIDRIITDEDGQLWIIDYKTSMPSSGESNQEFVKREEQSYKFQLKQYKSLLTTLSGKEGPVKTALYFTAIPMWHEVAI